MNIRNGGTAFPVINPLDSQLVEDPGMTMRQYYKAAALQGLLTHYGTQGAEGAAKICGEYADAMLDEDEEHSR